MHSSLPFIRAFLLYKDMKARADVERACSNLGPTQSRTSPSTLSYTNMKTFTTKKNKRCYTKKTSFVSVPWALCGGVGPSLSHTHTLSHTHALSSSLSHTNSLSLSYKHTLSHSHTHTHTLSLSLTHTHTLVPWARCGGGG